MDGDAGDGGETQILDGGTPPLGSPFSDGGGTLSEREDAVLYGETQALDDDAAETQVVEGLEGEEVAGDWDETQLVGGCEDDGLGVGEKVKTQPVGECVDEGNGGDTRDAGDWTKTQLVEECEVEGGNYVFDNVAKTQLVEECEEVEERVNDSGNEGVGDWGKTQLVEDTDEEIDDGGGGTLRECTQVLSDCEELANDGRDVKLPVEGSNAVVDAGVEDEEGSTGCRPMRLAAVRVASIRTCGLAARKAFTVSSMQQGRQQTLASETHLLPKLLNNSISCSTSVGELPPDGRIDNDSHGYVQNHEKDGARSRGRCSTAKKLFADMMPEDDESNTKNFAGLSYVESQEPGDLSQANALEVVERLILINGNGSSQEATPNKFEIAKSRPISSKRGALILAEKVDCSGGSNGRAEIFDWVNSREDDRGGEFFSKNKDILLHSPTGKGKSQSHPPKAKKCSMKIAASINDKGECKKGTSSKLSENVENFSLSDSRLLKSNVKNKRTSGNRTKKNLFKDINDLSNAKYLQRQQQKVSIASHDVGPDTQMAIEAIDLLAQCSPAITLLEGDKPPSDRDMSENGNYKGTKSSSKNSCPQKRTSSVQEGATTHSKRTKITEMNPEPQRERHGGSKMRENSEEPRAKTRNKRTKSAPEESKVSKTFLDGNEYQGTPVAHCTRHSSRKGLLEYTKLCSNKHVKKIKNLTGDSSGNGKVQNKVIANKPEQLSSERITDSSLNHVEKESTQHTSADNAQNLEPGRDERRIDVACRDPSSHPKQRRTATAVVHTTATDLEMPPEMATDLEMPPEVARSSKRRRVFIRSVSELVKYAKREPSNVRATSMLSSIIARSSTAFPILNSSVRVDNKTSTDFCSTGQQQNEPSRVEDANKTPKSNTQVQNSALKTPSKVINELSPTFSPLNPSKCSSRSLSKPFVARELLKLDCEKPLSNQQLKDSRRRQDMTSASILFSHHLDEDVIKRQKKILKRLGICEALSISDATHFVADSFFRTRNMLEAITLGKPVVTSMWLENCGQAGCFVNAKKFILRDAKKEKEIGFSMPISLASACECPLLQGKRVFITPNVKPSRDVVTSLVMSSSGQPLERIGRSLMKEKEVPDDLLVISCDEDYETCVPLLERGAGVFSSEFLLNGIVIQKLEYDRHRLFSENVKRTRSTTWLKDKVHGRFVPVSKCS